MAEAVTQELTIESGWLDFKRDDQIRWSLGIGSSNGDTGGITVNSAFGADRRLTRVMFRKNWNGTTLAVRLWFNRLNIQHDLVTAWEEAPAGAVRFRQGSGTEVEWAGPYHTNNILRDSTDPYAWAGTAAQQATLQTWAFDVLDETADWTLTLHLPATGGTNVNAGACRYSWSAPEAASARVRHRAAGAASHAWSVASIRRPALETDATQVLFSWNIPELTPTGQWHRAAGGVTQYWTLPSPEITHGSSLSADASPAQWELAAGVEGAPVNHNINAGDITTAWATPEPEVALTLTRNAGGVTQYWTLPSPEVTLYPRHDVDASAVVWDIESPELEVSLAEHHTVDASTATYAWELPHAGIKIGADPESVPAWEFTTDHQTPLVPITHLPDTLMARIEKALRASHLVHLAEWGSPELLRAGTDTLPQTPLVLVRWAGMTPSGEGLRDTVEILVITGPSGQTPDAGEAAYLSGKVQDILTVVDTVSGAFPRLRPVTAIYDFPLVKGGASRDGPSQSRGYDGAMITVLGP